MNSEHDIRVRLVYGMIFFGLLFSCIIARLFYIQILDQDFYANLGKKQHHIEVDMQSRRGAVLDRHGREMLFNHEHLSAFIIPKECCDNTKFMRFLKNRYPSTFHRIEKNPDGQFAWLKRDIKPHEVARIKRLGFDNGLIHFIKEPSRLTACAASSAVLGATDVDNKGISGIELLYDRQLKGSPAQYQLARDARSQGLVFDRTLIDVGQPGETIALTIDKNLQAIVCDELARSMKKFKAEQGCALVMDPDTGDILSMVNLPDTDKNSHNIIVNDCFELGSVMKVFTALAALDEKVVTIDELIDCEGKGTTLKGFAVENLSTLGILSFSDVIAKSSNVGTAKIALRLGSKLYDHLVRLGFGSHTGITYPGERSGTVFHPSKWSNSSPIAMSFGYEVMASMLQLGKALCIVANGGYEVKPRLVLDSTPHEKGEQLYRDEVIEDLKKILENLGSRRPVDGMRTMGKTGTARVLKDGVYSKKDHRYAYCGCIEKDGYRRVIVTFSSGIKNNADLLSWQIEGPLFQSIGNRMVAYDRLRGALRV